ncbi:MAG: class I SAM-dependent methyltransferase family protein [Janthinobacterium lividum]
MLPPRVPQTHDLQTPEGVFLPYRHWPASVPAFAPAARRDAVALVHDGSARPTELAMLVDALDLPGIDFFAFDAANPDDLQAVVDRIGAAHGVAAADLFFIGHGEGAVRLAVWAHDHAPRVRGFSLVAPSFGRRNRLPFAGVATWLERAWHGPFSDPRETAVERTVEDAAAIVRPVQLLIAGADRAADPAPQRRFFERLGSEVKVLVELAGHSHDVFGAPDSTAAVLAVRGFVLERFEAGPSADAAEAPAATDAAALPPPPPLRRPSRWRGRLSNGIRLGHEAGFDTGSAIDYVYRNEPQGHGGIGRRMDARYLDTVEARALRERERHIRSFVHESMERLAERRRDVRVLDIAAGPGRYLLDAVRTSPVKTGGVVLRDTSEAEVRAGQAWIARFEMQDVARYEVADALDRLSLASIFPRPTIAVASGLYERLGDDALVRRSLAGVGDAVQDGGYLIYTAAPWHPQDDPAHGRRRTQAVLDVLVEGAGFRKVAQRGDPWGLQTVSLAVRTE